MTPTIERMDGMPFGRAYKITEESGAAHFLPSVTTILKMRPDPEWDIIRESLGEEKYTTALRKAANRGTVMHRWLEIFLEHYGESKSPDQALLHTQNFIASTNEFDYMQVTERKKALQVGRTLFYNFYNKQFWSRIMPIKNVLHNEIFMYTLFKGGWAGASDLVYEDVDGHIVIADYKSSREKKLEEKIGHYKMQISCYMFKYAEMYGRIPHRGEILIANEYNDEIQKYTVYYDDDMGMKHYLREFLGLMDEFRSTQAWQDFQKSLLVTSN